MSFPHFLELDPANIDGAALSDLAAEHGVLFFRGLPLRSDQDFDAFVSAFSYPNFRYEDSLSNAVRITRTERVFTANEAPQEVTIYLHHEMAQTPIYPSKLFFFCEQAPETGGTTPLCRSDVLFELMQEELPTFAADCANKGLRYTTIMPAANDPTSGLGRSWQRTFSVDSPEACEVRMRELGYSWAWRDDGSLRAVTPVLPAVRELRNGRRAFFNQLIAAFRGWKDARNDPSKSITFGDGSPLSREDVLRTADLAESITVRIPWQAGDVALVDNFVAMHGRDPYTGKRSILASLVA